MIVFGMFVAMLVISVVFVAIGADMHFLVPAFVFVIFILAVIIVPIFEGDRIDTLCRDHMRAIET